MLQVYASIVWWIHHSWMTETACYLWRNMDHLWAWKTSRILALLTNWNSKTTYFRNLSHIKETDGYNDIWLEIRSFNVKTIHFDGKSTLKDSYAHTVFTKPTYRSSGRSGLPNASHFLSSFGNMTTQGRTTRAFFSKIKRMQVVTYSSDLNQLDWRVNKSIESVVREMHLTIKSQNPSDTIFSPFRSLNLLTNLISFGLMVIM